MYKVHTAITVLSAMDISNCKNKAASNSTVSMLCMNMSPRSMIIMADSHQHLITPLYNNYSIRIKTLKKIQLDSYHTCTLVSSNCTIIYCTKDTYQLPMSYFFHLSNPFAPPCIAQHIFLWEDLHGQLVPQRRTLLS
jgi:hypothetical protein